MDTGGRRLHLVWRVAIVFGAATLIWLFIHWLGDALFGADYHRGRHVPSAVAATALAVPMVVVAYRHLDRLPWSGLPLALGVATVQLLWGPSHRGGARSSA